MIANRLLPVNTWHLLHHKKIAEICAFEKWSLCARAQELQHFAKGDYRSSSVDKEL